MKKILFTIALVAGIALTSCQGFLDRDPSTSLSSEGSITSAADVEKAINGLSYRFTTSRFSYPSEFGIYADLLTDNFKVIKSNGQTTSISSYTITSTDYPSENGFSIWYRAAAAANKALLESKDIKDEGIDNLQGQLYAWRALCHFDLARMYCRIPSTVSNTSEANSGIIISDKVFEPDYKGTRATLADTYKQVIDDFTTAIGLLDAKNDLGYMNKYAAIALRARAYLYMGEYQKALDDAIDVIEHSGKSLYEISEYASAWSQQGTKESLLELLITDTYNPQRYALGYYMDQSGYAECGFNVDGELFQYLSTHPEDVRSKLIKDQTTASGGTAGYYPAKYPGQSGSSTPLYTNNPKIIRLSEVYLIAAEAAFYCKNDGGATSAKYINDLNAKRITGYKSVSKVSIDDIIFAYTVEMFCENQIAFAHWRNKKTITNQVGQTVGADHQRAILPIPQSELDLNKNLVQNPGY
ncbi:MAG: RagB/SusD family nutrient uptake outer membrane protein [Bacteroidales bacterium]|nr:RagB/SusD family nutrient uptake outer membrane protein [Bacteroidales bacterium]